MKSSKFIFSFATMLSRMIPLSVKRAVYRSPFLSRWVRNSLNRVAPQGLTTIEIAGGCLTGLRMALDLHTEKDYWQGTYEVELQIAINDLVKPGMITYDIGANIGYVTLMFARIVGKQGKVFSFEALPANFERLKNNVQLNRMDDRIIPLPFAVVDDVKKVDFLLGPSGAMGKVQGSAGRKDVQYTQSLSIGGISLDNFVYEQKNPLPQVVKMDIEGGEVMALPGMRRILEEACPIMLLELHGPEAARVAWDILCGLGYRICRMTPSYPLVPSLEALDWKAYILGIKP